MIGKNIQRMRKKAGLTQQQLGDKIGLTGRTVRKVEGQPYDCSIDAIRTVCAYFGYTVKYTITKMLKIEKE